MCAKGRPETDRPLAPGIQCRPQWHHRCGTLCLSGRLYCIETLGRGTSFQQFGQAQVRRFETLREKPLAFWAYERPLPSAHKLCRALQLKGGLSGSSTNPSIKAIRPIFRQTIYPAFAVGTAFFPESNEHRKVGESRAGQEQRLETKSDDEASVPMPRKGYATDDGRALGTPQTEFQQFGRAAGDCDHAGLLEPGRPCKRGRLGYTLRLQHPDAKLYCIHPPMMGRIERKR
ncbi:hypothetical protein IWZ01DRAFT_480747 [Phyllosticta capitalensis]